MAMPMPSMAADTECSGVMTEQSTNLHFHGLALPPVCHQDESIHTLVGPGQSFDYTTAIPADNSPGLYWYHPHPHGFSEAQVQGGASGALIVEGIDSAVPAIASLPHRTFILRDQLLPPGVPTPGSSPTVDPLTPSWDVSINYVPIRYPKYVPATIQLKAGERQFWRFVNSAANTIFNLQILYNDVAQPFEIYAIDGVPVGNGPISQTSVYLPPGSRVEFAMTAPEAGVSARLVTQGVDSGPTGDSAPARPLANLVVVKSLKQSATQVEAAEAKLRPTDKSLAPDLLSIKPVRTRTLSFSQNGNGTEYGSGAADKFYITVLGQPVKQFDMNANSGGLEYPERDSGGPYLPHAPGAFSTYSGERRAGERPDPSGHDSRAAPGWAHPHLERQIAHRFSRTGHCGEFAVSLPHSWA
jgi:FtsP/CotA-like multicopper oxidase with cupredoxin domain